jgi:transposase-like protein
MYRAKCRKCSGKKFWKVRRGKLRCKNCLYEFVPKLGGINLTKYQWKVLLKWFLRCQSVNVICEETGISKYKVLKALSLVRQVMAVDIPDIFDGVVEVDETYLGGQKKNKRKSQLTKDAKTFGKESGKGFGTTKQPVFGILCRSGKVYAELVDNTHARNLIPIITKKVKPGTKVCSDTWRAYTGLATKGYVHRTVEHREKEYVKGKNHINGLEGFWGYLKRQLASRGGIRRERLPYYLAEYVWRYNYRKLSIEKQINRLLNLVAKI